VLDNQRPGSRRLETGQRAKPGQFGDVAAQLVGIDLRELFGWRRDAGRGRNTLLGVRVAIDQEPARINTRVTDRPDLPIDYRVDAGADGEQVS
jgi:hypothetical protein